MIRAIDQLDSAALSILKAAYLRALLAQVQGRDGIVEWAEFRRAFIRAYILANLIGRSSAVFRLRRNRVSVPVDNLPVEAPEWAAYAETETITTAPFVMAINRFLAKVPRLRQVVDRLLPEAKARAFWVTGIEQTQTLKRLQQAVAKRMMQMEIPEDETGGIRGFIEDAQAAGVTNLAEARLENVYRTNIMSAANEGLAEQLSTPELRDETALWMLNEIQDRRTRGNPSGLYPDASPHFQMDGYVASPTDPVWRVILPPNGYQCRADIMPIGWLTAEQMGLAKKGRLLLQRVRAHNGRRQGFIDRGEYPDDGFKGPKYIAA